MTLFWAKVNNKLFSNVDYLLEYSIHANVQKVSVFLPYQIIPDIIYHIVVYNREKNDVSGLLMGFLNFDRDILIYFWK